VAARLAQKAPITSEAVSHRDSLAAALRVSSKTVFAWLVNQAHSSRLNRQFGLTGIGDSRMSIWTIVLIILVIALLGGFSGIGGGPFYGTGYYGGGGLGLIIVILLILLLLGKL
jgi:hypothetical protein